MRLNQRLACLLCLLTALAACDDAADPATGAVTDVTAGVADGGLGGPVDAVTSDAADGCVPGAACDDGDPCTVGDRCQGGACVAGVFVCACEKDSDCAALEDGDLCNGTLRCDTSGPTSRCVVDPSTRVSCPASKDVCTVVACAPKTGACETAPVANGTPCVDGDACTVDSACQQGACVGGDASWCACTQDADCAAGSAPCLGARYCDTKTFPYICRVNPANVVQCPTGKGAPCVVGACDVATGGCTQSPAESVGELCVDGVGCVAVTQAKPGAAPPCDDGDSCTQNDTCNGGVCTGGTDTCGCAKDSDCAAQEDGDPCTGVLYCDVKVGKCVTNPATVITCTSTADTACVKNTCQPDSGACKPTPVKTATPCEDGDPCTSGDLCVLGACKAGTEVCPCKTDADCADKDNADKCDGAPYCDKSTGQCQNNGGKAVVCGSGGDTACKKAACVKTTGACSLFAVELTEEICAGQVCRRVALPKGAVSKLKAPCEDGDDCTVGDVCAGGVCAGGKDLCACKTDGDCASQDDGDLCNGTLFCNAQLGTCQANPSSVVTCPTVDDTACVKNTCQPKTGKCAPLTVQGGTKCDDGDPCTKSSFCFGGLCGGGTFVCACAKDADCLKQDDGDLCNGVPYCDKSDAKAPKCVPNPASKVFCSPANDSACAKSQCDPKTGKCSLKPATNGAPCDDGDVCTKPDACKGGVCTGQSTSCDDNDLCTTDSCDPKVGCVHKSANCKDGNSCTVDQCAAKTGVCSFDAAPLNGKACDGDGDGCTVGEVCTQGVCGGGKPVTCVLPTKACEVASCVSTGAKSFQCVVAAAPASTLCDDGDPCTLGDHCGAKGCEAGAGAPLYAHRLPGPVTVGVAQAVAVWPQHDVVLAGTRGTAQAGTLGWAVTRLSQAGQERWTRELPQDSQQIDVKPVAVWPSDKGAVVVAGTWRKGTDLGGRVLTLSADGAQLLGDVTWGSASVHERVQAAGSDGAGGAWLVGTRTAQQGQQQGFLARVNVDGKPLSEVGFGLGQVSRIGGHAVRPGGGHVVGTERYNPSGQPHTCRVYGLSGAGGGQWSSAALPMNRLDGVVPVGLDTVAVGASAAVSVKPVVVRLDDDGQVRWTRELAVTGALFAVVPRPGGGVAVAGHTGNWDKPTALLAGLGPLGSVAWQQTLTSPVGGALLALVEDSDGALVAAGLSAVQVGNPSSWRPLLARATAWGGLVCSAAGKCLGLAPASCDDKNPCTDDLCGAKGGCVHLNHGALCDDGDPCTSGDACKGGKCTPKAPTDCTSDKPCAVGSCKAGLGCVETPKPTGDDCDDGDACTKGDACAKTGCVGTQVTCDDGVACTQDACDSAKGCVATANPGACDDSNPCTDDDCQPGTVTETNQTGCTYAANKAPCDDGVACTVGAVCTGGTCAKGAPGKLWLTDLGATTSASYKAVPASTTAVAAWPGGGAVVAATLKPVHGQYNLYGFAGPVAPKPSAPPRARVVRVGSTGAKIWDRLVGDGGAKTGADEVRAVVTDAEGVVAFGHTTVGAKGVEDGFAVALAAKDGKRRWLFRYGDLSHERIYGATRLAEGFVAVGSTDGGPSKTVDGWLVWVSSLGFQTQVALLGGSSHERLNDAAVLQTKAGTRIAVVGTRKGPADDDMWWAVVDGGGKLLWERVSHIGGRHDFGARVRVTTDGHIALAGAHFAKTGQAPLLHGLVQLNDAEGRALWRRMDSETSWSTSRHALPVAALGSGPGGDELLVWGHRSKQGRTARRLRTADGALVYSGKTRGQGAEAPDLHAGAGVVLADGGVITAGFNALVPGSGVAVARSDTFGALSCSVAGACADKAAKDCDDGNPCTQRECSGGTCVHDALQGVACTGKAFCAATHVCNDKGACVADGPRLFDKAVNATPSTSDPKRQEDRAGVVATADGGFLVVGRTRRSMPTASCCYVDEAVVRKFDAGGALTWTNTQSNLGTIGGNYVSNFRGVVQGSDGGYVAVGHSGAFYGANVSGHYQYGLIVGYTSFGARVGAIQDRLHKTEVASASRGFESVVQTKPGRYLAVGHNQDKAKTDWLWLYAVDADESGLSLAYSAMVASNGGRGMDVALSQDGEAAVCTSGGRVGYFAPETGKLVGWAQPKTVAGKSLTAVAAIDDGIITAGFVDDVALSGKRGAYALRLDAQRKVLWEQTYDAGGADGVAGLATLSDGRFAVAATAQVVSKGWQVRLLLLGGDGGKLHDSAHGAAANDYARGLTVLKDSRLLVVGQRGDGTASDGLIKTFTAWGHDQCVTAGYCADTPLPACNDKNPCTVDSCAPGKGCTNTTLADGHSCGSGKQCKGGLCQAP